MPSKKKATTRARDHFGRRVRITVELDAAVHPFVKEFLAGRRRGAMAKLTNRALVHYLAPLHPKLLEKMDEAKREVFGL